MLNSASDYKFVDATSVADRIHGNILPVVNPTSQTAQLYFENYLFILEAFYERINIESAGQNNILVPNRILDDGNIYALKLNSYGMTSNNRVIQGPNIGYTSQRALYIHPDTTYPNNHVNTGQAEDSAYHIYDFLQDYTLPLPEEKQPYYGMTPRVGSLSYTRLLYSDYIRAKFWTFNKMSKLLIPLYLGDFATQITHQTLKPDGSVNSQYDVGLGNSTMSYVRGYQTTSDGHGGTITYQLFKTIATYKQTFFTLPYATTATLIWKCNVEQMGGESSSTQKYVWGTKLLSIANGAIDMPSNLFDILCDDACNICGRPSTSAITLYQCYLLVDFEFPARLNGITWNWQPQYT